MGDIGDMWRSVNESSKEHRTDKQEWSKELLTEWCAANEVVMTEIQPWHIRLSTPTLTIDIYPQRQKWHNIKTQKRGQYKDLISYVSSQFQKQS